MVRKGFRKKAKSNQLVNQLHRIVGQLQAVERMMKQGKDEKQVIMLIDAALSSLRSLRNNFIKSSIRGKLTAELETLLALVDK